MFRMLKILMRMTHEANMNNVNKETYEMNTEPLKTMIGSDLHKKIIDLSLDKEGRVALEKMSSIVDKFKYAPHLVKNFKNSSAQFQQIALFGSKIQGNIKKVHQNCRLLARRIEEKFVKMGKAFRFFDLDKVNILI